MLKVYPAYLPQTAALGLSIGNLRKRIRREIKKIVRSKNVDRCQMHRYTAGVFLSTSRRPGDFIENTYRSVYNLQPFWTKNKSFATVVIDRKNDTPGKKKKKKMSDRIRITYIYNKSNGYISAKRPET